MHLLGSPLPILSERPTTLMSEGLMDAEALLPLCICHVYCCSHLKETKFSRTLADIFFSKLHDPLLHTYLYNYHMNTLHQLATAYPRNIPSQFWVAAFIPGRRYGEDTSNVVECINFDFKNFQLLNYYKRSAIKL